MKTLLIHVKGIRSLPEDETGANPFKTLPVVHGSDGAIRKHNDESKSSLPVGNGGGVII